MKEENVGKIGNFDSAEYVQPARVPAILSLIFGIISLLTIVLDGAGVFPGIIGAVCGLIADQRGNDSRIRKVGLTLSVIGTVLCMLVLLSLTLLSACYSPEPETVASLILG